MIAVPASEPVRLGRPAAGEGPVSLRLADLDARLDSLYMLQSENAERLRQICEALTYVERTTTDTNSTIAGLLASVRKHPLLARFIGG